MIKHLRQADGWQITDDYAIKNGDCITAMMEDIQPGSVDLAVFSPPFSSLFAYTDEDADMGNSRESDDEFLLHFDFFARALLPLIKPGRNVYIHLQQVSRSKVHHGYMGLFDIRGEVNRAMEAAGFHLYGEVTVDKCPQAQAIRTKSAGLTFSNFERDRAISRPALADYLQIFKAPGKNETKIRGKDTPTRDEWIEWARPLWREAQTGYEPTAEEFEMFDATMGKGLPYPIWRDIKETDTLNTKAAKSKNDERHVCPLQLPLIERVIRLSSNPGDTVLSPFGGVGSEGYKALQLNRKCILTELNPRYFGVLKRNLDSVLDVRGRQQSLFGGE